MLDVSWGGCGAGGAVFALSFKGMKSFGGEPVGVVVRVILLLDFASTEKEEERSEPLHPLRGHGLYRITSSLPSAFTLSLHMAIRSGWKVPDRSHMSTSLVILA